MAALSRMPEVVHHLYVSKQLASPPDLLVIAVLLFLSSCVRWSSLHIAADCSTVPHDRLSVCRLLFAFFAQIVHCDLAARNLLVDAAGRARVADFGLATLQKGGAEALTQQSEKPIAWTGAALFTIDCGSDDLLCFPHLLFFSCWRVGRSFLFSCCCCCTRIAHHSCCLISFVQVTACVSHAPTVF